MTKKFQRATSPKSQLAIIAALPEPAVITSNRWSKGGVGIIFANPAFCRLTGYGEKELVGHNTRMLHGALTDLLLLQHGRRPGRPSHTAGGEGWLYRKSGTPFFARWNFSPLDEGRSPGRLVAIYHDLSEVKHLHTVLLQSQKLATLGLLSGGLAHDFNNLITVINGYCEIMRSRIRRQPRVKRDLEEIHRAGLKASTISRQMLEFSRRQKSEVRVVNYNTLIREVGEILRRVAGDAVKMEFRLASDLGNVRIDPTQFQQVLLNLCFNAREAMPAGGKLTIRTSNFKVTAAQSHRGPEMAPGFYASMQVIDTGVGLEPGILSCVFEPFFTTKPHGTGLGLATVRGIIQQFHGHVFAQSAPGRGSMFEVFLPETPEPEQISVVRLANLPATVGTETILIIEDDVVLRKMIAGILGKDGYRVTDLATPADASAALATGNLRPQLVLGQAEKPAVAAFVRRLRAANRALKLISFSTQPPGPGLAAFPAKAIIHLPKPFALSTLILKVRQLLDAGVR